MKPWRITEITDNSVRFERYAPSGRLEYRYLTHAEFLALGGK
jgi:hypothetical protein